MRRIRFVKRTPESFLARYSYTCILTLCIYAVYVSNTEKGNSKNALPFLDRGLGGELLSSFKFYNPKKKVRPVKSLKKKYYVHGAHMDQKTLENIIKYYRKKEDARRLSHKIIVVSKNFGIDPFLFAALIRTESLFNPYAVSPTGCVGLTQFCTPGIEEVNYQTGGGDSKPWRGNVNYLNRLAQKTARQLGMKNFRYTWQKPGNLRQQKRKLLGRVGENYSLIYSAIFVKVLLARSYENRPKPARQLWYDAVVRYNGDKNVQHKYAGMIMRKAMQYKKLACCKAS